MNHCSFSINFCNAPLFTNENLPQTQIVTVLLLYWGATILSNNGVKKKCLKAEILHLFKFIWNARRRHY